MSDQMTRLQKEAEERYPDTPGAPENNTLIVNMRAAFLAGRTISEEQVEAAAKVIYDFSTGLVDNAWEREDETEKSYWLGRARDALEAAGMVIEE